MRHRIWSRAEWMSMWTFFIFVYYSIFITDLFCTLIKYSSLHSVRGSGVPCVAVIFFLNQKDRIFLGLISGCWKIHEWKFYRHRVCRCCCWFASTQWFKMICLLRNLSPLANPLGPTTRNQTAFSTFFSDSHVDLWESERCACLWPYFECCVGRNIYFWRRCRGKKKYVNHLESPGFLHLLAIKCDQIFI